MAPKANSAPQSSTPSLTLPALLDENRGRLAALLPDALPVERFLATVLSVVERNPDLRQCTPQSLYTCILQAAELGLQFGPLNQAHAVPYWNASKGCYEAQFQVGYLGLRDLAERYGDVEDMDAQLVRERDEFAYELGVSPTIVHRPALDQDRGSVTHYYCWARTKSGTLKLAVMTQAEVRAHRDRYAKRTKDGQFSPAWRLSEETMGLKTVIRRCMKLLARSPQLRTAVSLDEQTEAVLAEQAAAESALPAPEEQTLRHVQAKLAAQRQDPAPPSPPPAAAAAEDASAQPEPIGPDEEEASGPAPASASPAEDRPADPAPGGASGSRLATAQATISDAEWADWCTVFRSTPDLQRVRQAVLDVMRCRTMHLTPQGRAKFLGLARIECERRGVPFPA